MRREIMTSENAEGSTSPIPPTTAEMRPADPSLQTQRALVPAPIKLPAVTEPPAHRGRSRWRAWGLLALVVLGAGGGYLWWRAHQGGLPPGIAFGNGRIVADAIDIDTKFAGRISEILADEGDMVSAGQVVARMDTQDLAASLRKAEAQVGQAQKSLEEAHAAATQQKTQLTLAQQEFDRTNTLVARGFATNELLDQRRQALNAAEAALIAANDRIGEVARALDAATHDVELTKVNIADNTLVAPTEGRIQYRLANVGEVLPAGGKVFTMFDVAYVYMDIYLNAADAQTMKPGADARIVLDARPDLPIPATIAFIGTQAQFTPQAVDVKDERDKLMFRVRVKIDPTLLRAHGAAVRSGLPGVAYAKEAPDIAWPRQLQQRSRP